MKELQRVRLGDVADLNPRFSAEMDADEMVAFVPMSAVSAESARVTMTENRPYGMVKKGYTPFLRGDVLVAKITPCFENGKIAQAELPHPVGFGSTEFHVVRPREGMADARYLLHYLRQERVLLEGARKMTGSGGQRRVPQHFLAGLEIPLPDLSEQRRIAEVLDRAEALRAMRRAALAQIDVLSESLFFQLFGHSSQTPVTVGDRLRDHACGWRWELLRDVAKLATGHTPDRKRPEYWKGDVPWITLSDIRQLDGRIAEETGEYVTELGIQKSSAVKLPAGTVCFSRTASVGFVTVMGSEMATSQDFVNWVCAPRLNPIYVLHAFMYSRSRLRALSTGSTHKTIYFPTVERFRILVPPLSLQAAFAQRLARIEQSKVAQRASLAELDALFASLQHRAFRGEL
jgi:type I restriction enzyme S subunit